MENRIRSDYTKSLQDLQDGLLILGSMVEKAIHKSMQSLKRISSPDVGLVNVGIFSKLRPSLLFPDKS